MYFVRVVCVKGSTENQVLLLSGPPVKILQLHSQGGDTQALTVGRSVTAVKVLTGRNFALICNQEPFSIFDR